MPNRLLTLLANVLTLVLMALGAYLHDAELASSCPTWPLCPGQFSDSGIIYFHRFIALVLFILSGYLAFTLNRIKHMAAKWANWFFGFVLLQAILGGLTAVLDLPAVISIVHLLLSLVTLAFIATLHHALNTIPERRADIVATWPKDGLLVILILFFFQSILGGLVRHSGAGSACGLGVGHLLPCTDANSGLISWWPLHSMAQLQMLHRLSGIALFALALPLLIAMLMRFVRYTYPLAQKARNTVALSIILLFIQIYSGFYNIASSLAVHATVFHLIIAALLMSTLLKTRLYQLDLERAFYNRIQPSLFSDVLELFKPRLAGLVMITMLIGALLVPGPMNFLEIFFSAFLIFMVVASATTLNCWMERDVDRLMERTRDRALAAGRMKPKTALIIGLMLGVVSLPVLYFLVNPLTAWLGLAAHLLYLLAYTPMKRFSAASLFVGAIPGALPPVMGWTTITGTMDATAWCLFAILFVWQLPHFLAISVYYRGDYEAAGLKVFARENNFTAIRRDIFVYTSILMGCALSPVWWAGFSFNYEASATILSALFMLIAIMGFFINREERSVRQWARGYFLASIIYLPLLLASMVFFQ